MRREAPVYFDEHSGVWGITRYDDLRTISKDPGTFSNAGGIRPRQRAVADDDRHGRSRARAAPQAGQHGVHAPAGA
ncbi:MAG: hypothetical protein U5R31_05520 [Acidimicrobiia bacterium]|nr:hypothetical protein [Acidimicrobiia bacterium]